MDSAAILLDASDAPADDEVLAKKQSSMLERLAAKEAQRTEEALRKRSDVADGAAPAESVQRFLDSFTSQKVRIEKELDVLGTRGEGEVAQAELDQVAAEIQELEKSVSDAVYFLPSYDVRASQGALMQIRGELDAIRSKVVPKRKFSFGAKKKESKLKDKPAVPNSGGREQDSSPGNGPKGTANGGESGGGMVREGPGIRGRKGETIIEPVNEGEFALSHLEDCSIYLTGVLRALYIDHMKNCRVFSGPVTGAVHIEQVSDSVLVLASHQIRIHHTSQTDFYLRVRSRPIVEHTSRIRFAPYIFNYDGLSEQLEGAGLLKDSGDWANVDDFRWLRATRSPNWSILAEADRLTEHCPPRP